MYTTRHLCDLFGVSHQTIKNWGGEFAAYLSPTATPPPGSARRFSESDLAVLALVAELKRAGATYEHIHAALRAGQRGEKPSSLAASDSALLVLRQRVVELEAALRNSQSETQRQAGMIDLLKQQLSEAQRRIIELEISSRR